MEHKKLSIRRRRIKVKDTKPWHTKKTLLYAMLA
jgi:hypothetical protein